MNRRLFLYSLIIDLVASSFLFVPRIQADELLEPPISTDEVDTHDTSIEIDAPDPLASGFAMLGLPYIWGGATGRTYFGPYPHGTDCSGFCAYVYKLGYGLDLPASTIQAYRVSVPVAQPQYGDLVFWNMNNPSPRMQHMGLYLGGNAVLQSGGLHNTVNIDSVYALGIPTFRRFT